MKILRFTVVVTILDKGILDTGQKIDGKGLQNYIRIKGKGEMVKMKG